MLFRYTKDNGIMVNNMELVYILVNRDKRNKEYGKMVKELDGYIKENQ